ncbi:adenylate/guanylate cyclase domain-containing protein [Aureisphaera galaxeae]|uniref:adenylate/guanylate cyclase domain-containing protein n=1 Tax=Aureisphaera galaxeae TaxID=1538023 RepID=UPI0023509A0A|nr:adenylate/guanylate cyclase domain-containing protein [Aureisphaera galaxeae]MDC8004245.1 adenylate/guanylate cyclase domain-containing protein [Aureisphaera galaxeae]
MYKSLKEYGKQVIRSMVFWCIALVLYSIFRFYGLSEFQGVSVNSDFQEILQMPHILRLFTFSGLLMGFLFAHIEYFFEKYASKRLSIGFLILFKTFLYLFTITAVSQLVRSLIQLRFGIDVDNTAGPLWEDEVFMSTLLYVLLVSIVFSFIKIANEKFGKGVFLKMLLGRYKKPQEEKRIFMFLDLQSSTTIAEKLGHFKYSQLIQDCFYDLNEIVPKYAAEIYQYVGDEAVLSWPYAKGLANNNCVQMYFEFAAFLASKAAYYNEKYGLTPLFKAGLHGGTLMVAEVGVVKKELAFHGDVINTSARIQAECNTYEVPILISESLKDQLSMQNNFVAKHMGNVLLKGKENKVNIYTLMHS